MLRTRHPSPRTRRRPLAGAALSVLLLSGAALLAQRPGAGTPPAGEELFADIVSVNVVNVDVFVTDKKGNSITGLTKDDFQIFEDKKPMAVTNFYAIEGGKPTAASDPPPAQAPAAPAAAAVPEPVSEDQRLRLVVYIDNFNLNPFNRNRVMRELRTFLNQKLSREDRVMLVTYDRSLKVRRTFTSDPALIAAALGDLETVSGHAVHHESERRDALTRIEESQSPAQAMQFARSYAESIFNDLNFTIDALKTQVDMLAGMPGRKAVLYISDGLPMTAGQELFYAVEQKFGQTGGASLTESFRFDASRRFRELTSQANANRITFYTIDAGGLRTYGSISAEHGGGAGQSVFLDQITMSNLQSPLQYMAETTGGQAVINANNVLPHLEKIARDFQTYYSLGYSPAHLGDGRYHTIEVKVKRKGIVVRHREGYRDKSPEAQMADGTLAALNFPYEENPLAIEVTFDRASRKDDGHYLLPVQVKIPLAKLLLIPREQSHEGAVRLYFAVMDSEGGTSDVQQARVPIRIPNAEVANARGKHYTYSITLLMRGGDHRVAVGAHDDVGSERSFLSRMVRVGAGP
ncbi:MAG TPA: VWA domain-containing protein [Thermoanaerobaculia bacterium]|nr:VWA domain-containing protein [Thermoanaerobaculia bacterium]